MFFLFLYKVLVLLALIYLNKHDISIFCVIDTSLENVTIDCTAAECTKLVVETDVNSIRIETLMLKLIVTELIMGGKLMPVVVYSS